MAERCPACGILIRRGEDRYSLGALWLNIILAELLAMWAWLLTQSHTWPPPDWKLLKFMVPIVAVLLPLLIWPFARLHFLAFDLCLRPATRADFPSDLRD
jgi:hypothetical protein